ncbi:hypothetical protein OBBRIDRAFT_793067 [Obba rivulosa]|uniref:Uncharacterized protein n=1 Tax=Obba rivulosa TaxID=1052685 RepID=A0A8E2ATC6_9APHY|nr:hypothetical protein OBBRIDRAFT_793067 [Obba rivulosa]
MAANLLQQGQQCQADALGLLDIDSTAIPQAEHGQLLEKYEKLQNQWSDVRAKGPSLFQGIPEHFQFSQWEQSAQELNGAVTASIETGSANDTEAASTEVIQHATVPTPEVEMHVDVDGSDSELLLQS